MINKPPIFLGPKILQQNWRSLEAFSKWKDNLILSGLRKSGGSDLGWTGKVAELKINKMLHHELYK